MTYQEQGINRLKNTQKESFPLELETLLEKYKISKELGISSYQLMQSIDRFIDNLKIFSRQLRSLYATAAMVEINKGKCFYTLEDVANYLNNQ